MSLVFDLTQDDDDSNAWTVPSSQQSAAFSLGKTVRSAASYGREQEVIVIDDEDEDEAEIGHTDDLYDDDAYAFGDCGAVVHYEPEDDELPYSQLSTAMELSQDVCSDDDSRLHAEQQLRRDDAYDDHSGGNSNSSGSSSTALGREAEKKRKAQERAIAREERAKVKAAEKEARRLAREAERTTRAQERGAFADAEVMVIMEQSLRECELGQAVTEKLAELYAVAPGRAHAVSGLIRWTRRDYALGGAAEMGDGVEELGHVCVLYHDPARFYELMTSYRPTHHDFPALSQEVARIRRLTHSDAQPNPRICLLPYGIEAHINRHLRHRSQASEGQVSPRLLDDVVTYLLVQEGVDCRILKTQADAAEHLESITRALANARYRDGLNEYVGVQRFKSTTHFGADHWRALQGEEKELVMLRDAWLHQLQAIPGVSEAKARSIVRHFPTPQSLLQRLHDETLSEQDRISLLQDKFSDAGRNERSLACKVFKAFTSVDASEPL